MDGVSLTANTRAALNGADASAGVTALKIALDSDKAIVALIEQSTETAKALPTAGQGQQVDRIA
jgi:hypothetical protein